jgi:hypothetical protein
MTDDEQMCEAVVDALRGRVRYFMHTDDMRSLPQRVNWIAASKEGDELEFFTFDGRSLGNPNHFDVNFALDALKRGTWVQIPPPSWA